MQTQELFDAINDLPSDLDRYVLLDELSKLAEEGKKKIKPNLIQNFGNSEVITISSRRVFKVDPLSPIGMRIAKLKREIQELAKIAQESNQGTWEESYAVTVRKTPKAPKNSETPETLKNPEALTPEGDYFDYFFGG